MMTQKISHKRKSKIFKNLGVLIMFKQGSYERLKCKKLL